MSSEILKEFDSHNVHVACLVCAFSEFLKIFLAHWPYMRDRRGYWSLELTPPPSGKPRKRSHLHYIGKRSSDPQARMAPTLHTAERKAEAI